MAWVSWLTATLRNDAEAASIYEYSPAFEAFEIFAGGGFVENKNGIRGRLRRCYNSSGLLIVEALACESKVDFCLRGLAPAWSRPFGDLVGVMVYWN